MPAQTPPEELQTPSLTQFVQLAVENRLEDLHTCSYGTVTSYDATKQEATVQLIPRRATTDEEGNLVLERPAPLLSVPVIFPGSGDWSMTFPVKPGDTVLVVFFECPSDAFLAGGGTDVDTGDYTRKHHMSDAVCYPGFRSKGKRVANPAPPTNALALRGGGGSPAAVYVKDDGTVEVRNVSGSAVSLALKSDVTAVYSAVNSHEHSYIAPGTGGGPATTTGGPTFAAPTGTAVLKGA